MGKELEHEYRKVFNIGPEKSLDYADFTMWLEQKVQGLMQGKRYVYRNDLVVYAGKIWRVDWCDGATLGLSTNGNDHKEVHESVVRPLASYFNDTPIKDLLP